MKRLEDLSDKEICNLIILSLNEANNNVKGINQRLNASCNAHELLEKIKEEYLKNKILTQEEIGKFKEKYKDIQDQYKVSDEYFMQAENTYDEIIQYLLKIQ